MKRRRYNTWKTDPCAKQPRRTRHHYNCSYESSCKVSSIEDSHQPVDQDSGNQLPSPVTAGSHGNSDDGGSRNFESDEGGQEDVDSVASTEVTCDSHLSDECDPAEVEVDDHDLGGTDVGTDYNTNDEDSVEVHDVGSTDVSSDHSISDEAEGDCVDINNRTKSIYSGARVSYRDAIALVFNLSARNKFTISALADIIKVLNALMPNDVESFRSINRLLKSMRGASSLADSITTHRLCSVCARSVPPENSACAEDSCKALQASVDSFYDVLQNVIFFLDTCSDLCSLISCNARAIRDKMAFINTS